LRRRLTQGAACSYHHLLLLLREQLEGGLGRARGPCCHC
jgi:hypothetical protein